MQIAIVEKYPTAYNYNSVFNFEFDRHSLVGTKKDKILKKDIELDIDSLIKEYDYIILVGAEPCKLVGKVTSVTEYQGYLMHDKFLPMLNPMAVKMRPSLQYDFDKSIVSINSTILGKGKKPAESYDIKGITEAQEAMDYILWLTEEAKAGRITHIAMDTETTALYPRDGYVIGISISHKNEQGVYIDTMCLDDELVFLLQELINLVTVVFHNKKFDDKMLAYHFGLYFPKWEDTMLMHYVLDETEGSHGLKFLAIKFTNLGDYDSELDLFKKTYCSTHKVLVRDFTYDLIPFDIMYPYACLDTAATFELYWIFVRAIEENAKLKIVYERLLKEGTDFLIKVEENGIPMNIDKANEYIADINDEIAELTEVMYEFPEVKAFEKEQGSLFNVNSPNQKRAMFFDILGLPPQEKTATGALSTGAAVIDVLAEMHPLPKIVQDIMGLKKIKSTYLEKFVSGADRDGRLRTGFNLHTVSSGRLSSSGKINAQQLPRKDKRPKKCIEARKGFKIVSQDLQTAEMYIAAVLSGDKALQQIFIDGVDYHGAMAVSKFGLPCTPDEVKALYPDKRQDAKTISFEILYKLNFNEPALKKFPQLKKWLKDRMKEIEANGFIYSHFGRKRRLEDVNSPNRQEAAHTIRSGINFLVQSVASDVNLLAGIDMQKWIEENDYENEMKIFGLVHDSILAEVHDDYIELYCEKLNEMTRKNRAGMSIPGTPIGIDLEIGQSYGIAVEINTNDPDWCSFCSESHGDK